MTCKFIKVHCTTVAMKTEELTLEVKTHINSRYLLYLLDSSNSQLVSEKFQDFFVTVYTIIQNV